MGGFAPRLRFHAEGFLRLSWESVSCQKAECGDLGVLI